MIQIRMCLAIVATFHKVYTTSLHQVPIVPILNHKVYATGLHQYSHSYEDYRRLAVAQPPIAVMLMCYMWICIVPRVCDWNLSRFYGNYQG